MSTVSSIAQQLGITLDDANLAMKSDYDNMTDAVSALVEGFGEEGEISIDKTLTVSGSAADAQVVGDRIRSLMSDVASLTDQVERDILQTLDFSNWDHGSFTEILTDGTKLVHTVSFNGDGYPISIDGTAIIWG